MLLKIFIFDCSELFKSTWNWKPLQNFTKTANLYGEGFIETFKHNTHMEVLPLFLFWHD